MLVTPLVRRFAWGLGMLLAEIAVVPRPKLPGLHTEREHRGSFVTSQAAQLREGRRTAPLAIIRDSAAKWDGAEEASRCTSASRCWAGFSLKYRGFPQHLAQGSPSQSGSAANMLPIPVARWAVWDGKAGVESKGVWLVISTWQ
jgi:hypothetical protein